MVYFPPNIRDNIYAHLPLKDAITARTTLDKTFTHVTHATLKDVLAGSVAIPNFPLHWFMSQVGPRYIVGDELLIFSGKKDETRYMVCIPTEYNFLLLMFRDQDHNLHILLLQAQNKRHNITNSSQYTIFNKDTAPVEPTADPAKAKAILKQHFLKNLPHFDKKERDMLDHLINPDKPEKVKIAKLFVAKPVRYEIVPTDRHRVLNPKSKIKATNLLRMGEMIPLNEEIPGATIFYNLETRKDHDPVVLGIKFLKSPNSTAPIIELVTSGHFKLRYNSAQAGYATFQYQKNPHARWLHSADMFLEDITRYWSEIYSFCYNNYDAWASKIPKYVKFFYAHDRLYIGRFLGDANGSFEL